MREQALETSRAQQRENANRIIEFSQKNARLSSELSARDDEIASLKRSREDAHHKGSESSKERDDLKNQYLATRVRLQALEDEHEVSVAKYEASKAESEELRAQIKHEIKTREKTISDLLSKHDEAIAAMTSRLESEMEDKANVADATRKQLEERMSRAVAKEKDMHKQQLADFEAQRQQDSEVQRARLATLAKAMEGLQAELREESNKNGILSQELSVLKDLAEVGSTEMQERVNYVEREKTRERTRLEGQLSDVKEQLRQQVEQKQQRDQLMSTIEQQLTREREAKFAALQRVRAAEDEAATLVAQVDGLVEETANQKKDIRAFERKLALAIQNKDAEIIRLTRRNEVLGEAVTRLTGSQGSTVTPIISRFFTNGFQHNTGDDAMADRFLDMNEEASIQQDNADSDINTAFDRAMTTMSSSSSPNRDETLHVKISPIALDDRKVAVRASTAPLLVSPVKPSAFVVQCSPKPKASPHPKLAASLSLDGLLNEAIAAAAQAVDLSDKHAPGEEELKASLTSPVTPRSFAERDEHGAVVTDSGGSGCSGGSGGSGGNKFIDKLKSEVQLGKGIQLPFSPKRAQTAPTKPTRDGVPTPKGKENQSKIPTASSSDRIKRASEFMKARTSSSANVAAASAARKAPVF